MASRSPPPFWLPLRRAGSSGRTREFAGRTIVRFRRLNNSPAKGEFVRACTSRRSGKDHSGQPSTRRPFARYVVRRHRSRRSRPGRWSSSKSTQRPTMHGLVWINTAEKCESRSGISLENFEAGIRRYGRPSAASVRSSISVSIQWVQFPSGMVSVPGGRYCLKHHGTRRPRTVRNGAILYRQVRGNQPAVQGICRQRRLRKAVNSGSNHLSKMAARSPGRRRWPDSATLRADPDLRRGKAAAILTVRTIIRSAALAGMKQMLTRRSRERACPQSCIGIERPMLFQPVYHAAE